MNALTTCYLIIALILSANGEELKLEYHGKLDIDAMDFRIDNLSSERCDEINYKVGRNMTWEGLYTISVDADTVIVPKRITIDTITVDAHEKVPAWVVQIQEKGAAYRDGKKESAKRYKDRLSEYSKNELRIAKSMRLLPWDIDRNQLRKWARETPE